VRLETAAATLHTSAAQPKENTLLRQATDDLSKRQATPIGNMMVQKGLVTEDELQAVLKKQKEVYQDFLLGELFLHLRCIHEDDLYPFLSDYFNIPWRGIDEMNDMDPDHVELIPESMARAQNIAVVAKEDGTITLAMSYPQDVLSVDAIRAKTRCRVIRLLSPPRAIKFIIDKYYERS